ncbi:hypothetical protein GCM10010913_15050 [Paenibacillus aceti]|uniref:Uncharacterized protein n=1 Tax=Paenibacillus aceti TaxID=1820010 RepID=A0ABQ1VS97_9BACL|nr:hypothetical protein GCM10010913_15050 [Paenibacillus aceti]
MGIDRGGTVFLKEATALIVGWPLDLQERDMEIPHPLIRATHTVLSLQLSL